MLLSPGILRCTCEFDHCYGYLHNISDYCFGVVSIVKKSYANKFSLNVDLLNFKLGYLKDSNAGAHSVDTGIS